MSCRFEQSGIALEHRVCEADIRWENGSPFRADVTVIGLKSSLRAPSRDVYQITGEGDKTLLEFNNVRYRMPAPVAATIRSVANMRSFRPAELTGPLNAEGVLSLS